ncbi:MAG: bifunctional non-ous end joining protein LigD [Pseudonocardiales bacterium]|jgi:DNA ligase-1|nr:bifunctional non-ous end joining protein LigD [Pseudonocardiales bacterium]
MLSATAREWPQGDDWVMQAKWDGFRMLVTVDRDRRICAWSRHGTSMTGRLQGLLRPFADVPPGSVFDGELVAVGKRDGLAVQDYGAVGRAVFLKDDRALRSLRFVAFDLLELAGADIRYRPWSERDQLLRDALPTDAHLRIIENQPPDREAHAAIVRLGFEGTVLKRRASIYRSGRRNTWRKCKHRHTTHGVVLSVQSGGEGTPLAVCDVGGRQAIVHASADIGERIGESVRIAYSRLDADGSLREASVLHER